VGRLYAIKGPDVLIRALAAPGLEATQTVLIGDGPEREALRALVQELGIADRVTFAGARSDARTLMPAFDAYVLSSRSEGTPMVVLEAMQAALPVVATDVGGVAELLGGVGRQWLVPPEAPEQLGAALRDVRSDADARHRAGAAGAERARDYYAFERWVTEHVAIYTHAVARRLQRRSGGA
jgi:glycosyltransferase involved in cell wall biosynthesis